MVRHYFNTLWLMMLYDTPENIKKYLTENNPQLNDFFAKVNTIPLLEKKYDELVLVSVIKVVSGQMLSRIAAKTIYERVLNNIKVTDEQSVFNMTREYLVSCGLSNRKAKTIQLLSVKYRSAPSKLEKWKEYAFEDLLVEVKSHWGLSDWSAQTLAIFYFAHNNVFPQSDGTLKKVLAILNSKGIKLDIENTKSYKSYLALYLWKFYDDKLL